MVVEDFDIVRKLMQSALATLGYTVEVVRSFLCLHCDMFNSLGAE